MEMNARSWFNEAAPVAARQTNLYDRPIPVAGMDWDFLAADTFLEFVAKVRKNEDLQDLDEVGYHVSVFEASPTSEPKILNFCWAWFENYDDEVFVGIGGKTMKDDFVDYDAPNLVDYVAAELEKFGKTIPEGGKVRVSVRFVPRVPDSVQVSQSDQV